MQLERGDAIAGLNRRHERLAAFKLHLDTIIGQGGALRQRHDKVVEEAGVDRVLRALEYPELRDRDALVVKPHGVEGLKAVMQQLERLLGAAVIRSSAEHDRHQPTRAALARMPRPSLGEKISALCRAGPTAGIG